MRIQIPVRIEAGIPDFSIRSASQEDIGTILSFIKQLADYEKLSHEVVATEAEIGAYLFSENPFAFVLIGEYKCVPVGFSLFFPNFSTFLGKPGIYLEDLFIQPEHRGKGFGKALLAALALITSSNGFGRLDWSVLAWNQPAVDFYIGLGAVSLEDWNLFRLSGTSLVKLGGEITTKPW